MFYLFFILLAVILLFGVKFAGIKEVHQDGLSLGNSKAILGSMAILIMFHHISQTDPFVNANDIQYMQNVGILFVATFFFFSGYGLVKSLKCKSDYLKHFFRKRFVKILIPFIFVNIIYLVVFHFLGQAGEITPMNIVKSILDINMINGNAWYIIVIAMFYIIFYFAFRFLNEKLAFLVMILSIILYVVIALPKPHNVYAWFGGEWWYNTCFTLFVGMVFARFENAIVNFLKKFYYIILPVLVAVFVVGFKGNVYALNKYSYWCEWKQGITQAGIVHNRAICYGWQVLAYTSFVCIIVMILLKLKFSNPVISLLGKISLEIYLIHEVFLQFLRSKFVYIDDNFQYAAACVICSVVAAFIINIIDNLIEGLLLKDNK